MPSAPLQLRVAANQQTPGSQIRAHQSPPKWTRC